MRRLVWLAAGLGAGVAGAVMTSRWMRRTRDRVAPAAVAREVRGGVLDLSKLVAESLAEGKRAMEERERELRADRPEGDTDAAGAPTGRR